MFEKILIANRGDQPRSPAERSDAGAAMAQQSQGCVCVDFTAEVHHV
ncbi:hypothetical protein [Denitromonas iodatirespirans]|uniref:Uncharacterized protein n=1 Tax=Denitromonas iodatirespirans TaxID=2795389 RepID=A0A944DAN9_DENI1|nr:hypothetical protein [Denitromonas iodatirespirans]MBT0963285.1 hypothetical protein [Denitromonas iodatirespirans]